MILTLKIITYILGGLLTAYGMYQVLIVIAGLCKKKKVLKSTLKENKILCVIAARNEAKVIGQVIGSLQRQNYATRNYKIIVVPNNCQDNTAEVALSMGAEVYEPKKSVKNKGDALNETFEYYMKNENFDAICVFDADNIVDVDFLAEMNKSLENGESVVAGYRDSKNPHETSNSGRVSISFWLLNKFYNGSRQKLNLPSTVTGTGFMVSRETLEKLGGWNTTSITEDNEFNVQCACNDIMITYNENAIFYDEQPLTSKESWKQRRRWTTGDWQVLGLYFKPLMSRICKKKSVVAFDTLMQISKSIIQLLVVVNVILNMILVGVTGEIFFITLDLPLIVMMSLPLLLFLINTIIWGTITAFSVVLLDNHKSKKIVKAMFSFWLYLISYIVINGMSFMKKQTKWQAIEHTSIKKIKTN